MRIARLGDKVNMNCPHGAYGTITSSSLNVEANDHRMAREGDEVTCDMCGVTRSINANQCSPDIYLNDRQVARVGDPSTGICNPGLGCCPHTTTATISQGSGNTTGD